MLPSLSSASPLTRHSSHIRSLPASAPLSQTFGQLQQPSHRRTPYRHHPVPTRSPLSVAAAEVLPASSDADYVHIARLRANAFYENDRSRFVESFKKKFVAQEMESLKERTVAGPYGQLCECLLARPEEDGQQVIGCIDIRVPRAVTGKHPAGVPAEDEKGAYILNVVVEEDSRGQGVGKALMREAMSRAVKIWQAENLYTHVEADNEVALHLYLTCGFKEQSSSSRFDSSVSLGKLLLLKAGAEAVNVG
ncbi:acyl-CoA N-acyltransferase [Dunaliella salina]|uniref:Acyl-CoA N-acyltransferase n=1 Tax=Dunaliella salina TaxID=3046 RepID=A0ABQ7GQT9_DUNSA|nr:acyl-CoA N-acyltransferase [Dunaliella salina]|eukprot:KAF5836974.1 acyl-CoA N-acyltransferase [Dunaliella salina]